MSWPERIENDITITTGDGKVFTPLWATAQKNKEFNISEFEFPELEGALIKRKKPKAMRFTLTVYFQGENNLEDADEFWNSADDNRAWRVSHPQYGDLKVQPANLNFDDRQYNVTIVTAEIIETIKQEGPESITDVTVQVVQKSSELKLVSAETFAADVSPGASEINEMNPESLQNSAEGNYPNSEAAQAYRNAVREANQAVNNAGTAPLKAMTAMQNVISTPARFETSVRDRLNVLKEQFESLRSNVSNMSEAGAKKTFETQQTANITAQCEAVVTNTNYRSRGEVLSISEEIFNSYDTFTDDLVTLQTTYGGNPDSYIPNPENQRELASIVNLTVAKLFDQAFNLRRERTFYTPHDTNIILLTHKLYGLDANDENLNALMEQNNFSFDELLIIEHGRRIKYYA